MIVLKTQWNRTKSGGHILGYARTGAEVGRAWFYICPATRINKKRYVYNGYIFSSMNELKAVLKHRFWEKHRRIFEEFCNVPPANKTIVFPSVR
jgi:hypothetical protein